MKHYDGTTMLYVLENDSFKEGDIKIGITQDIKKRLATLNTSVPSKFTVSYLHAFSGDRALEYEKLAHTILDDFRSENGEFFKIDAFKAILMCSSWGENELDQDDEIEVEFLAEGLEVSDVSPRKERFSFSAAGINIGELITSKRNGETAVVHSDTTIMWRGKEISLSESARIIKGEVGLDSKNGPRGPNEWLYNGETLDSLIS